MGKERPIIMGAESVRGILAGRKSQTRRVVKRASWMTREPLWDLAGEMALGFAVPYPEATSPPWVIRCPYGQPGDRLWVKEALRGDGQPGNRRVGIARYAADGEMVIRDDGLYRGDVLWEWRRPALSPIHCPRWASRLTLEIVAVRAERVRDITTEGAVAEGCDAPIETSYAWQHPGGQTMFTSGPRARFAQHWDALNARRGYPWASNPYVWVIEFRRAG